MFPPSRYSRRGAAAAIIEPVPDARLDDDFDYPYAADPDNDPGEYPGPWADDADGCADDPIEAPDEDLDDDDMLDDE